ncbi:MAG: BatD family protein [Fidelibacterota bacterium]
MRNKLFFLVLLLNLPLTGQVRVRATVDANRVSIQEPIGLKIEALESDEMPEVDLKPLARNFSIVSGPAQQTNIQWINGRMTSTRALTWTLVAKRTGQLMIPKLIVRIGKRSFQTQAIRIQVEKSKTPSRVSDVFIQVRTDKKKVFLGEQVTATYKLYTRVNLSIEDIQYPKGVGFWTENLRVSQTIRFRDETVQGIRYKAATLYKVALFTTRTGRLSLEPLVSVCNVEVQRQRRPRSLFDDSFFNSMFKETVKQYIRSDSLAIEVIDYPEGQPVDFTGAVGKFNLRSSVDTQTVHVNEAITFRVELEGTGNLNLFNLPELQFPRNMEVFPPTSTFKKDEFRDQLTGKMTWEYILIPRSAGHYRLPKIELPYFDPGKGIWEVSQARPIDLQIQAAESNIVASANFTKEEVELLGEDIHYIRTEKPRWRRQGQQSLPLWVWTSYGLALAIFVLPGLLTQTKQKRLATKDIRQSRGAFRSAKKILSGKTDDPFAVASKAIYRYVKAKFYLTTDQLDPLTIETSLRPKISVDNLEEILNLARICDAGRYAPSAAEFRDTILNRTLKVLKAIDQELA